MKNKTNKKTKSMGRYYHEKTMNNNIKFDSKSESEYYTYLLELKSKGKILDIELQPEFILQEKYIIVNNKRINGSDKDFDKIKKQSKAKTVLPIKYKSDFKIIYKDGSIEIIDVKGIKTPEFKIKEKMFKYAYPELANCFYCVVKYKDAWLTYEDYEAGKKLRKKEKAKNTKNK